MARDPRGSSSTAIVSTHSRPAIARLRETSCSAVRTHSDGDSAARTVSTPETARLHRAMRRRPARSANTMTTIVMTMPNRTVAKTVACSSAEPVPRSAEAKVSTWVSSPNSIPATRLSRAIAATIVDCCAESRSGVHHQGVTPGEIPSGSARRTTRSYSHDQ